MAQCEKGPQFVMSETFLEFYDNVAAIKFTLLKMCVQLQFLSTVSAYAQELLADLCPMEPI